MIGLGCHSRNYGSGTPEAIFDFIMKLGFEYIDVDAVGTIRQADVLASPEKNAVLTRELSEKFKLKLAEYFMGEVLVEGKGVNPSQPDPGLRERMVSNFAVICRFARQAGFVSIMGAVGSFQPEIGYDRSFEHAATTLQMMTTVARDHGVAFHVEPNRHSLLDSPQRALAMVKRVPELRFTVDFLHYQVNGFCQNETLELLAYAGHMHARQAAVNWPKCPYEYGEIDYDAIIQRLVELRWNGVITLEFWNGPAEEAAGISPVDQTILMRYELKRLLRKYLG